jgi:hypothetical protein
VVTLADAATVSVPIEKVDPRLLPDCDITAEAVTVSSPKLADRDTPLINGDPTFCTPPPLTEANANSVNAP